MNNILRTIGVIAIVLILTANTVVPQNQRIIYQPAQPQGTIIKTVSQSEVSIWVSEQVKKGYQVQHIAGSGGSTQKDFTHVTVIMVKY